MIAQAKSFEYIDCAKADFHCILNAVLEDEKQHR